jgi:formiminoglutamase
MNYVAIVNKDKSMTKSNNRDLERIINNQSDLSDANIVFLNYSSDIGTLRNLGRRGSLYAPEAILNVVKKLSSHNLKKWSSFEIASSSNEIENFENAQKSYIQKVSKILSKTSRAEKIVYLGGGHDHIYPSVMAINQFAKKVVIINLDAHLDTRVDTEANSGTPFRQLDRDFDGSLEIIQLGIHEYANSISTMSNLSFANEVVATYEDVRYGTKEFIETEKFLKRVIPFKEDVTYVFSLDADVLASSVMEGVSAVNHRGLPYDFIEDVLIYSIDVLNCQHFGIFEYNPLYDNLSQKGARTLASLIYQIMDERSIEL